MLLPYSHSRKQQMRVMRVLANQKFLLKMSRRFNFLSKVIYKYAEFFLFVLLKGEYFWTGGHFPFWPLFCFECGCETDDVEGEGEPFSERA